MRLTKSEKSYIFPCRINGCIAEEWMWDLYGCYPKNDICDECPFMKIINKLAEYEDKEEKQKNYLRRILKK